MDAAPLRLVDFGARLPVLYGHETREGRAALAARTKTEVVGPTDLRWQVRLLTLPSAMRPHPPSEMLALADPATGWTPLPLGVLLAALALPFMPLILLLRSLRVLPWTVEARTYPWGRRHPPIVLAYEVRGRDEAAAAIAELTAALARGSGGPVLPGCERVV
jgi:hypothetical protein